MYQYTNGFSCALSGNGNEFVLCFAQQCPSFDSTDKLGKITKEPVASLIMSADKAKELARAIETLCSTVLPGEDAIPTVPDIK